MKKMKSLFGILVLLIIFPLIVCIQAEAANAYCYNYTGKALAAAYDYFNDFYLKQASDFASEIHYGSPSDVEQIKKIAKNIVGNEKSQKKKCELIATWVTENIEYNLTSASQFSIDVLINREADCMGYAYLLSDMMKAVGITAVPVTGYRGDMISVVDSDFVKNKENSGHAWVFANVDNSWLLYDPLWAFNAVSSAEEINKWYFITNIEGAMPHYTDMDYSLQAAAVIYKNGKFYVYSDEGLSDGTFEKSANFNLVYDFTPHSRRLYSDDGNDGYKYVSNNKRQQKMISGECYTDGWITYNGMFYRYMQPNGVVFSNIITETSGNYYYEGLKLKGNPEQYSLYFGKVIVYDKQELPFEIINYSDIVGNGGYLKYNIILDHKNGDTYGKIKIDSNGIITVEKEGLVQIEIETFNKNGESFSSTVVSFYAANSDKIANCYYSRHIFSTASYGKATLKADGKNVKKCISCGKTISSAGTYKPTEFKLSKTSYIYNGKVQTPTVTVKDSKGNTLKKGTDYTVKYSSGRKNPGKYTVTITFKGAYSGTKTLTYTIAPKVTSKVTASQTTSTITLKWNKVTGATGYRVYQYNSKTKKWDSIKTTTSTSFKVQKLKAGTTYKFKVKAYTKSNGTIWGEATKTISVATKPAAPKITKLTTTKGKVTLNWSNVSGESGYELYYSAKKDSGFKKVTATKVNVVKASKSKLTSGKTYYFKVRAYKTVDGKKIYGAWSKVKSVIVK